MREAHEARDGLVDRLGRLPLLDLDPVLARRLLERAHARVARAQRTRRVVPPFVVAFGRVLEPAVAGLLAVANLAWAVVQSLRLLF
jgi:hypothetical protein